MEAEEVINLHLSRGKIFVWNSRDVRLLRETHHIVGSLSGALPRAPRQNIQLGLPLELMPEEAYALISYGVGVLVRLALPNTTEEDVTTFQEARKHSFEVQKELYTEQIRAKKEVLKGLEHQQMSKRKLRRLEKKKKMRVNEPETDSVEKSMGGDDAGNEERLGDECTQDNKDEEKGSGLEVEENNSVEMIRVTSSMSSEGSTDPIQAFSTYTTSDSKLCFSSTQFWGDPIQCRGNFQDSLSDSQECDILQSQKTDESIILVKDSEDSLLSARNTSHSKEGNDCESRTGGATGKDGCKTTGERCQFHKKEGVIEDVIEVTEEMLASGIKQPEAEMISSKRTIDATETSKKEKIKHEKVLGSDCASQGWYTGLVSHQPSGDGCSEMNLDEEKKLPSMTEDVCSVGCSQSKTKSQSGVGEEKDSVQVSDLTSKVDRSLTSPVLEGKTLSLKDRQELQKEKVIQDSSCLVQLFTEAKDNNYVEVTDWSFPSTDQEKLRAAVFMHFWEQGYYLTSGMKFGGDFLVYKGNPLLFHSTYIAICVPYEKCMLTQTLIAYGRLGPIVKKTVVLCSLNENDEVRCVSLQWSGI